MKDMILVSGFNVFPRVVEEAIYAHPSVSETIVIGVPDEYHGEVPKAFVKLKDPNDPLTPDDLLTFLRKRLGKHEIPGSIEFRRGTAQNHGRQIVQEGTGGRGAREEFHELRVRMTTRVYTHEACLHHDTGPHHPECPDRLRAILDTAEVP